MALAGLLAILLALPARGQEPIRLGQTKDEVLRLLGQPAGSMDMGETLILMYPEGNITIAAGVVSELPKKKIYARKTAGGKTGTTAPRSNGQVWPPTYSVSAAPSAKEMAAVIPGFGFVETVIAAAARQRGIAYSPEEIRREALAVWREEIGNGSDSAFSLFKSEAARYRALHLVKKKHDYKNPTKNRARVKCGAGAAMEYLPALPAGGRARGECWLLGSQKAFYDTHVVGAYVFGKEYDQLIWTKQHWDAAGARWDSISPAQQHEFRTEFAGLLRKKIAILEKQKPNPGALTRAASIREIVRLHTSLLRARAYEKFAGVLNGVPIPPP